MCAKPNFYDICLNINHRNTIILSHPLTKTILYSYLDMNHFDNLSRSASLGMSVLSTLTI